MVGAIGTECQSLGTARSSWRNPMSAQDLVSRVSPVRPLQTTFLTRQKAHSIQICVTNSKERDRCRSPALLQVHWPVLGVERPCHAHYENFSVCKRGTGSSANFSALHYPFLQKSGLSCRVPQADICCPLRLQDVLRMSINSWCLDTILRGIVLETSCTLMP